tara:strand:- start:6761 stop:7018 length:258 start_codon:yes stop_codon:yes gene_type:complete
MAIEIVGKNNDDGTSFGVATSEKISFYGVTAVTQQSSGDQAAVATTAAVSTAGNFGYGSAQANAIVTLVNKIRTDLVTLGLIKGS